LKTLQIPNFMNIHPMVAEFFHTNGRTDRHCEASSHFRQFWERA
jgi:hypothetical protein